MAELTIAFVDIYGSVGIYEALGNERAAQTISHLTRWIGSMAVDHGGHVVKMLGDGVLMSFQSNLRAAECVLGIQEQHVRRVNLWPEPLRLRIQAGVACGEVVQVDGDCFGDAVNVASRLCDLAGPDQILVAGGVMDVDVRHAIHSRYLGSMSIRGRLEPCDVYSLEWKPEVLTEHMTIASGIGAAHASQRVSPVGRVELGSSERKQSFDLKVRPLTIGRALHNDFVVSDPRVSRQHARIDIRFGNHVYEDTSSYGSWMRFSGSNKVIVLRRQECFLHGAVDISLGVPFADQVNAGAIVRFRVLEGSAALDQIDGDTATVQSPLLK